MADNIHRRSFIGRILAGASALLFGIKVAAETKSPTLGELLGRSPEKFPACRLSPEEADAETWFPIANPTGISIQGNEIRITGATFDCSLDGEISVPSGCTVKLSDCVFENGDVPDFWKPTGESA